jgi:hypothetical protein
MNEYKIREEDGEVVVCDSCGSPAATAEFSWGPPFNVTHKRDHKLLCRFCANTFAGYYIGKGGSEFNLLRSEIWRAAACFFNLLENKEIK